MNELLAENSVQTFAAYPSIAKLYGPLAPIQLQNAYVLVIGLGGVGSWAAEALVRNGVGQIGLVDPDDVCSSNVGRQLHTLTTTIGKPKVQAMKDRLLEINPALKVHVFHEFFDEHSATRILASGPRPDFVIDAIDRLKNKLLITNLCLEQNIAFLVSGASGGKAMPWDIKIDDIGLSSYDPLLLRMRKRLRKLLHIKAGRTKIGVNCVFSTAKMVYTDSDGQLCSVKQTGLIPKLDCHQGLGVAGHVTGTFGLFAAAYAVNHITKNHEIK